MDITKFHHLVREMRAAQIAYFRDRTQSALVQAKALEAKVDQALATMQSHDEQAAQLSFGGAAADDEDDL